MGIGGQGDGQLGDTLHFLLQEGFDTGGLRRRALHDEFIVDLHDEPGGQTLAGEPTGIMASFMMSAAVP